MILKVCEIFWIFQRFLKSPKSMKSMKDFGNLWNLWNVWNLLFFKNFRDFMGFLKVEILWNFWNQTKSSRMSQNWEISFLLPFEFTTHIRVVCSSTSDQQQTITTHNRVVDYKSALLLIFHSLYYSSFKILKKKKPMIYNPYSDISLMTPTYHRRARATARALLYFVALFIKNILYVFQELVLSSFVFTIHLCCAALSKYKLLWCVGGWVTMFILPNLALKLRIIFHCDCFTANI